MSVKIYTSYYGNPKLRNLQPDIKTASISNSKPDWFETTYEWKRLSPNWTDVDNFKCKRISFSELAVRYGTTLIGRFGSKEEARHFILNRVGPDCTLILLCWEKNASECHRSILAKLFPEEYMGEY